MASAEFPPKLTIDRGRVLRLFTGDTFYSSSDASLREAILNAIDAIARQRDIDPAISAEIDLVFHRSASTMTISDNGVGMTEADLSELFSKVGASASQFYAASSSNQQKMIGEFGIGVMSYFLVCDEFEVQTKTESTSAIGLRFSVKMIDEEVPAEVIQTTRTERGTTIVFRIKDANSFDLLLQRFSHWVRNVKGLNAVLAEEGTTLGQGGLSLAVLPVDVDMPDWIFDCTLGPPNNIATWRTFDGRAHVDVLYSGVFIERIEFDHLWCIEGSIYVDPKKFRPKLNREGFVGTGLKEALDPFLRTVHPIALARAAELLAPVLEDADSQSWTVNRLATLWLAIPRSAEYAGAAKAWDAYFRQQRLIRQLLANNKEHYVSVNDLILAKYEKLYVVPPNWASYPPLERSAIRTLRDQGKAVVVGIERDSAFLTYASFTYPSTETIVTSQFSSELPPLEHALNLRDQILRQESIIDIALLPVIVRIVNVGPEAGGIIVAGTEIWINASVDAGRAIAHYLCDNPYGLSSLITACLTHAPDQIQPVANLYREHAEHSFLIGPVRRQAIRLKLQ